MKAYAISGAVHVQDGEWLVCKGLPTFYLLANVQGIVSEAHAETIARDIVTALNPKGTAYVFAVETTIGEV